MARRETEPPLDAHIDVPAWMWGGNPNGFFGEAGLAGELVSGSSERWRVRVIEPHPPLVEAVDIAGPRITSPRWDVLQQAVAEPFLDPNFFVGQYDDAVAARVRKAERTKEPVDAFAAWQVQLMVADGAEVPAIAAAVWSSLRATTLSDGAHVLAHAGVHLIRRSPQLVHRTQMTSMWLRQLHDPELAAGNLEHLRALHDADELVFASARSLYDGTILFDAYTGPLLGALAPVIWAFPVHRTAGVIVFSLGQPLAGTVDHPTELLHLLPIPGATEPTVVPRLAPTSSSVAISWWAQRLNEMFKVLTNPAIFTDSDENYSPDSHLQALITVEQLFRRVNSAQTVHRDANARRVLFFTILDTLERLVGTKIESLCSLAYAEKALQTVRDRMPASVAALLLPGAERAVRALETLENGFFISRQAGHTTVSIPGPEAPASMSVSKAAPRYVRVLRDATHGHGSNKAHKVELTNALLAQHTGEIPHDLGLLGYLYLLRLLLDPQHLANKLHRQARDG